MALETDIQDKKALKEFEDLLKKDFEKKRDLKEEQHNEYNSIQNSEAEASE